MHNIPKFKQECINSEISILEEAFLHFVKERLGITIHKHQRKDLANTIKEGCYQFDCRPSEYLTLLKKAPNQSTLLDQLISGVTIGETYFYRDKTQMKFLKEYLLPKIIKMKRDTHDYSLRVWSAGCSSGEEIYTISILLNELLPDVERWTIFLLGTDINTQALQKAISGVYTEWSMRSIPETIKTKYFALKDRTYHLDPKIKKSVKFDYLNLNEDSYPSIFNATNAHDLILCRNVLIYFDNNKVKELMQRISSSLIEGGYLLLGASDPINLHDTSLVFQNAMGIVLMKGSKKSSKKEAEPVIKKEIHRTPSFNAIEVPAKTLASTTDLPGPDDNTQDVSLDLLLEEMKWEEVLKKVEEKKDRMKPAKLILAKAIALANLGKIQDSLNEFESSLEIDSTNKYTYFNYALALFELNQLEKAELALKKAIYLDHEYVAAHYHLGLLMMRENKISIALKSLNNALTSAQKHEADEKVPSTKALTYGHLVEILKCEIDIYSGTENKNDYKYKNKEKA